MPLHRPSRRDVLALGATGLAAALLRPGPARAEASAADRKFLFVYCRGGWDTTHVFSPMSAADADVEAEATVESAHGLSFVAHPGRPEVSTFFERYGDRACVLNGVEVQSVTHPRCRQIALTGRSDADVDDWAARLAAAGGSRFVMPHLVLSGPSFTSRYTSRVVRVGGNGQLPDLLDGSAITAADVPVTPLSDGTSARVDAYLRERLDADGSSFAAAYATALDDVASLRAVQDQLDLTPLHPDCARDLQADFASVFDCFELGLSRCAMVECNGWCDQGWDTHQDHGLQSANYEVLFGHLTRMMAELESRPGEVATSLADEVVVVVFSEMGRHPRLNAWGGKDHWTFTSVLLLGAGIRGGQVIGGLDAHALGERVDLDSGASTDSGEALLPGHLGATLLALGDVDPEDFDLPPIGAVLA